MRFSTKIQEICGDRACLVFSEKRKNGMRRVKYWIIKYKDSDLAKIAALSTHIKEVDHAYRESIVLFLDCKLSDLHEHTDGKFYTLDELRSMLDPAVTVKASSTETGQPGVFVDAATQRVETLGTPIKSNGTMAIDVRDQDSVIAAIKQMVSFLPAGTVCTIEIPVNRVDVVKIINE